MRVYSGWADVELSVRFARTPGAVTVSIDEDVVLLALVVAVSIAIFVPSGDHDGPHRHMRRAFDEACLVASVRRSSPRCRVPRPGKAAPSSSHPATVGVVATDPRPSPLVSWVTPLPSTFFYRKIWDSRVGRIRYMPSFEPSGEEAELVGGARPNPSSRPVGVHNARLPVAHASRPHVVSRLPSGIHGPRPIRAPDPLSRGLDQVRVVVELRYPRGRRVDEETPQSTLPQAEWRSFPTAPEGGLRGGRRKGSTSAPAAGRGGTILRIPACTTSPFLRAESYR